MGVDSTDLLIIGAGFSGLLSALLAQKSGLSCVVIEQNARTWQCQSHAHYLNAYSLEILASAGLSFDMLSHYALAPDIANRMVVCHQLNLSLGCIDLNTNPNYQQRFSRVGCYGAHLNIPGFILYQLLKELALKKGIVILWQHRLKTCIPSLQHIVVESIVAQSYFNVIARFVLACDGAQSTTCQKLGLMETQKHSFMRFLSIACHGSIRPYIQDEAMLYWIYHEALVACMVNFDSNNLQVLQIPIISGFSDDSWTKERIKTAFSQVCAVSEQELAFTFTVFPTWSLRAGYTQASDREKWVYILGDAMHRILPAGGLGLNTAFADVYNLIWKIASRASAKYASTWLSSYVQERTPEASRVVQQSIENYHAFMTVADQMTESSATMRHLATGVCAYSAPIQSMWLQLTRYLHTVRYKYLEQKIAPMLALVQQHFDGIAMHNATYYQSDMIFNAQSCQIYALDVLPYQITVGMRLQNFTVCIEGIIKSIFTVLSYHHWTLFLYQPIAAVQVLIDRFAIPHQVYTIEAQKTVAQKERFALPLRDTEFLIVRPDAFVFAYIDYRDLDQMQAVLTHLTVLGICTQ